MDPTHELSRDIELLATVAHELRSPVAAIQYAVRVLDSVCQADSALQQARAVIGRQLSRIARISDDLLSTGYLETGKLELCKQRTDLREIVHSAIEGCQPQLDARHHTLQLQLPEEPLEVVVDPLRVTQVFANLLDNASKYSDEFGVISLGVECTASEVTIRIVDHGMGIGTEFLPRIFDLFAQADQARTRSSVGMGIGLNLVKRLVELHDGTVVASSAGPGRGSTFTVCLPRNG